MAWTPYLYLKNRDRYGWAAAWQAEVQQEAAELGRMEFGEDVFLAPCAVLIGLPGKAVVLGERAAVGARCFLRGPVDLGPDVSVNPNCHLDGGGAGIVVGTGTRIGPGCQLFAFNHGMAPGEEVRRQRTASHGIRLGRDVWLGGGAGVVDGVAVGDHAVVGLGAVVTRDVPPWAIVAGNPARQVGDRRDKE